jgi:hypothetical protein
MSELNNAPKHIQLAVDLIELLEQNKVDPQLALDALAIVADDCRRKVSTEGLKVKSFTTEARSSGEKKEEKQKN